MILGTPDAPAGYTAPLSFISDQIGELVSHITVLADSGEDTRTTELFDTLNSFVDSVANDTLPDIVTLSEQAYQDLRTENLGLAQTLSNLFIDSSTPDAVGEDVDPLSFVSDQIDELITEITLLADSTDSDADLNPVIDEETILEVTLKEGEVIKLADDEFITLAMGEAVELKEDSVVKIADDEYVELKDDVFVPLDPEAVVGLDPDSVTSFNEAIAASFPQGTVAPEQENTRTFDGVDEDIAPLSFVSNQLEDLIMRTTSLSDSTASDADLNAGIENTLPQTVDLLDNTVNIEGQTITAEPGSGVFSTQITHTVTQKPEGITPIEGKVGVDGIVETVIKGPVSISGPVQITAAGTIPVSVQGGGISALDLALLVRQGESQAGSLNA